MVIVYGTCGKLSRRLEDAFPGVVAWPRNRPLLKLSCVEDVVLAVKFLGHLEEAVAVAKYGRNHVHRVRGGYSRLAAEIRKLLASDTH